MTSVVWATRRIAGPRVACRVVMGPLWPLAKRSVSDRAFPIVGITGPSCAGRRPEVRRGHRDRADRWRGYVRAPPQRMYSSYRCPFSSALQPDQPISGRWRDCQTAENGTPGASRGRKARGLTPCEIARPPAFPGKRVPMSVLEVTRVLALVPASTSLLVGAAPAVASAASMSASTGAQVTARAFSKDDLTSAAATRWRPVKKPAHRQVAVRAGVTFGGAYHVDVVNPDPYSTG